jgi:hypothetical protein
MNQLQKPRAEEITRLHNEIISNLRQSLDSAIRIGQLLIEQKDDLKHGQWGLWIQDNLPFTDRTARNYMRVYRERDRLKTETVSDLQSAYKLLARGDIEAECCFGRYNKPKWGLGYCIDYCHGQCGNFGYGINLSSGGLCSHPDAHEYGSRPPSDWYVAYKQELRRREDSDEYFERPGCNELYVWVPTMKACPRDQHPEH